MMIKKIIFMYLLDLSERLMSLNNREREEHTIEQPLSNTSGVYMNG